MAAVLCCMYIPPREILRSNAKQSPRTSRTNKQDKRSKGRDAMTTITTALLLAGLALPGIPAEQGGNGQPDTVYRQAPGVFYVDAAGRSYLGVDIQDVTAERVNALKLKEERGVEITMVDQDAPAGKAGLKEHDVILEFNGTAVESEEQLRRLIREVPPGRNVA